MLRAGAPDQKLRDFLDGIIGVVDANSFESLCLWQEYTDRGETWEQNNGGMIETVGELDNRPVNLSLFINTVKGQKILFVDAISQLVDHAMIDAWMEKMLPPSAFRKTLPGCKSYPNRVNAMNFSNVFQG